MFSCSPDAFTLQRTWSGYLLTGRINVGGPGYDYTATPLSGPAGFGRGTLYLEAPPEAGADPFTPLDIRAEFFSLRPVSRVVIDFASSNPPAPGPGMVECVQIGGAQY